MTARTLTDRTMTARTLTDRVLLDRAMSDRAMKNDTVKKASNEQALRLVAGARSGLATVFLGLAVLSSLAGMAAAHPAADGVQKKARKAHPAKTVEPEPVVAPVVVAPPPPPPTPGEMPPNAPKVTYEDGLLSIAAENSTLADILMAVKAATGTPMDIPPGAGADRVWVTLGPGPARPILAALLTGTSLDYVIQASDADPNLIQSVQLSPRKGGKMGETGGGSSSQSFASRYRQSLGRPNFGTTDGSDSESSAPETSVGTGDSDAVAARAAAPTAPADGQPAAQAAAVDPSSSGVGVPNASLSARLPLNITEADAHPTPVADPSQAIPQMQNLFELRRQLQAQQNAQQKAAGTR